MLQNVEQQHAIEAGAVQAFNYRSDAFVKLCAEILLEDSVQTRLRKQIDAGNSITITLELHCQESFAAAEIQDILIGAHQLVHKMMARPSAVLDRVLDEILFEFRVACDAATGLLITGDCPRDVARIPQTVDVTNLGSVVRRNRDLFDSVTLVIQLDYDLRVKVEIIRHFREIDFTQRVQAVSAIAAVEFGQVHPQGAIFERREDTVADVFVHWHAALEWSPISFHHA